MVGIAARVAHGAIGSTSPPHKLSPTEPGGVLYVSSPHMLMPPMSQMKAEAGIVATVTTTNKAQSRADADMGPEIGRAPQHL
jgi:hypothetical protein